MLKSHSITSILICIFLIASSSSAQELSPELSQFFESKAEVQQCMSSLENFKGCLDGLMNAVEHFTFQSVGDVCCQALNDVDTDCWPKFFPSSDPLFPPFLKNLCGMSAPSPSPSPL